MTNNEGLNVLQKHTMKLASRTSLALAASLTVLLAACGGGGGGGTTTPTTPTNPTPTTPDATLQLSVPTPTYAPASVELASFNVVNAERLRCGFGMVAQSAALDLAASNHANYVKLRLEAREPNPGHTEDATKTGFTAVTGTDRAKVAGYSGFSAGEMLSFVGGANITFADDELARRLMNTVYHLAVMFNADREVGVAVSKADFGAQGYLQTLAWQSGLAKNAAQQVPTEQIVTFPCNGTTGVANQFIGESPDPFNGVAMGNYTTLGHPIYVYAPTAKELKVDAAELTNAAGATVPTYIYVSAVDPARRLAGNQVFVIPLAALDKNATYNLQLRGNSDGKAFAKAIQFKTGAMQL